MFNHEESIEFKTGFALDDLSTLYDTEDISSVINKWSKGNVVLIDREKNQYILKINRNNESMRTLAIKVNVKGINDAFLIIEQVDYKENKRDLRELSQWAHKTKKTNQIIYKTNDNIRKKDKERMNELLKYKNNKNNDYLNHQYHNKYDQYNHFHIIIFMPFYFIIVLFWIIWLFIYIISNCYNARNKKYINICTNTNNSVQSFAAQQQ